MAHVKAGSTDPELLRRIAVLCDDPAWREFFGRYDPLVRLWCSAYRFDAESVDELRQRVWIEMARRMPAYHYDPGGSFRGWLRRLCHHRAIDMYRERRELACSGLSDDELVRQSEWAFRRVGEAADDGERDPRRVLLLRESLDAQEAVKRKVKPGRWEIFWRVAIEGEAIADTAAALGLKYATVYASVRHVAGLLKAEGQRRRARLGQSKPRVPDTE